MILEHVTSMSHIVCLLPSILEGRFRAACSVPLDSIEQFLVKTARCNWKQLQQKEPTSMCKLTSITAQNVVSHDIATQIRARLAATMAAYTEINVFGLEALLSGLA